MASVSETTFSASDSDSSEETDDESVFTPEFTSVTGVQPYRYQPTRDTDESDSTSSSSSGHAGSDDGRDVEVEQDEDGYNNRPNDVALGWCQCGNCRLYLKPEECQCCKEIRSAQSKLYSDDDVEYPCITHNPRFQSIVLDREALQVAGLTIALANGTRCPDPPTDE